MRGGFVYLGVFVGVAGLAMNLLLGELRSDFFRAYLPPWVYVSYALIAIGVVVVSLGLVSKGPALGDVAGERGARVMAKLALFNSFAGAVFVVPVVVPSFRFPILITQWPGIYMVLAYFSFITVGVLGMAAWSFVLVHLRDFFGKEKLSGLWFAVQVFAMEIGVYGLAVSMFLGGYVGSWLAYTGAGAVVVGAQMEFSVIPSAVSIFLVVAGTSVGALNVLFSGRSVAS